MMPGFEDDETERVTSTKSRPFKESKTATAKFGSKQNKEDPIEVDPIEEITRKFFEEAFNGEL